MTATMSSAEPAGAAAIRPSHAIYCDLSADVPYQYYRGTIVSSIGRVVCTTAPDVMQTTVIIWRYDGGGRYTAIAHKTSNQVASDLYVIAQVGCDYNRAFPMHTQVKFTAFHGNWWSDEVNSQTVTMYC
ncbi:hypothetical protein [Jatrophihabitans sp.]|uniref:hypothetical protein n=1 Tax=Jatrophihabitans sp. TaxID=1932789 RepID=UPI002C734F1F|nr:hypothetical protein [Jatrophihabitans sp.]